MNVKLSQVSQRRSTVKTFKYKEMKEITKDDYKEFLKTHDFVMIENVKIPLVKEHLIEEFEPKDFKLETTSTWSFLDRGS